MAEVRSLRVVVATELVLMGVEMLHNGELDKLSAEIRESICEEMENHELSEMVIETQITNKYKNLYEQLEYFRDLACEDANNLEISEIYSDPLACLFFAERWINKQKEMASEMKRKAELYEKLRRMNPREFAELYRKNIETGVAFDKLVERWPE